MKKPLKCKAWDRERNKWIAYGFCLLFDVAGEYTILNTFRKPFIPARKLELVWSMGKQDEDGKDIYEGDIVRSTVYREEYRGVVKHGEYDLHYNDEYGTQSLESYGFYVHWLMPKAQVQLQDGPWIENADSSFHSLRVIGNIYEHPELIT